MRVRARIGVDTAAGEHQVRVRGPCDAGGDPLTRRGVGLRCHGAGVEHAHVSVLGLGHDVASAGGELACEIRHLGEVHLAAEHGERDTQRTIGGGITAVVAPRRFEVAGARQQQRRRNSAGEAARQGPWPQVHVRRACSCERVEVCAVEAALGADDERDIRRRCRLRSPGSAPSHGMDNAREHETARRKLREGVDAATSPSHDRGCGAAGELRSFTCDGVPALGSTR